MKPNYIKKWTVSAGRLYLQVIALIDFIVFLSMNNENFDLKYNRVYFSQPIIHNYVPTSPFPKRMLRLLLIFGLQVAALIYAGYLQTQRNRKIFSIFWPALIGLIILISCVLITGNYQFNTNINITILWLIPEAYYIAYDVLIAHLIKRIPLPLNINWQFQAKCIYIILSAIFPLIGYTVFKLKKDTFNT